MTGSRPDWVAVGRIIGDRRRALGLPKNEAARLAKVSNTTWRLLEAASNHNPTDETLVRIAWVIEVEPRVLFQAAGRSAPGTVIAQPASTPGAGHRSAPGRRAPAELPPSYPPNLTPYFVGRREILVTVASYLEDWDSQVAPLVLTGPRGIGKTEVAARYLADHRDAYDRLWWVDASSHERASDDFVQLAEELEIAPADGAGDLVALARAVIAALRGDERRWLLVIDAADGCPLVKELPEDTGRARILLTSSRGAGWRRARPLAIVPLAAEDAAKFLRQRTGGFLRPEPADGDQSPDAAEELAAELGHIPLALERAGAYVDRTGISLRSFLDLARRMAAKDRLLDLLDQGVYDGEAKAGGWLPELSPKYAEAWDLLRLLAFVAPSPLHPVHLTRPAARLPDSLRGLAEESPLTFGAVARGLRRLSLVTIDEDGLWAHRIVQAAVRRSLAPEERAFWATAAVRLLLSAFPAPDGGPDHRRTCEHLLPHARAAIQYALLHDGDRSEVAVLMGRIAEHLRLEGRLSAARLDAEAAIGLLAGGGAPASAVVPIRQTCALIYVDLGEVEPARSQLLKALEASGNGGLEPHAVELLEAHLAGVDAHRGRYDSASPRVDRVCAFIEEQAVPTAETAALMSAVASTLQLLAETEEAKRYFGAALTLRRELRGSRHHGFALDCYGLAGLELHDNRPHRAAYGFQLGIDVLKDLYGEAARHPRIGDGLRGLATVSYRAGDLKSAIDGLDEADKVYEAEYDFDHPVRKAVATTRELLRAVPKREADHPRGVRGRTSGHADAETPPPLGATKRYIEQMLAISNYAEGFDRDAEAATALRLGDELLDLGVFDGSLVSLDRCLHLAEPGSLLALRARLRRGQALTLQNEHERALGEYKAILEAANRGAAVQLGRTARARAERVRARVERQLKQLEELIASTSPAAPVAAEVAGRR